MRKIVVGVDVGVSGYCAEVEEVEDERMGTNLMTSTPGQSVIVPRVTKSARLIPVPVLPLEGERKTYDRVGIVRLVQDWARMGVAMVVVEKQQVFPKMGSFAGFLKGYGLGTLTTALAMAGIPYEELRPADWKRNLGIALGGSSNAIKTRSIQLAQSLYPNVELRALEVKPGARTASHDKAEALLLAEVAWRIVTQGRVGAL